MHINKCIYSFFHIFESERVYFEICLITSCHFSMMFEFIRVVIFLAFWKSQILTCIIVIFDFGNTLMMYVQDVKTMSLKI